MGETSERVEKKNLFLDVSLLTCDILISISDTPSGAALNGNSFTLSLQHAGASAGRIPQQCPALMGDVVHAGHTAGLQTTAANQPQEAFPIVISLFYLQFPQEPRG